MTAEYDYVPYYSSKRRRSADELEDEQEDKLEDKREDEQED